MVFWRRGGAYADAGLIAASNSHPIRNAQSLITDNATRTSLQSTKSLSSTQTAQREFSKRAFVSDRTARTAILTPNITREYASFLVSPFRTCSANVGVN